MLLREAPSETVEQVHKRMAKAIGKSEVVENSGVRFNLTEDDPTIAFNGTEVPATVEGLKAFGQFYDVPVKFLDRLDLDMQEYVLNNLADRAGGEANVLYHEEDGVDMVRDPAVKFINPVSVVEIAGKVIDASAPVVEVIHTMDEFRLDVMAPEGFDRGIGGDKKVGDITRGGLRFGQSLRVNQGGIAPWVSEYLYRLDCTNGMEREDAGLRVSARGSSVEAVLAELEHMADTAFRRVEETIEAFYDLRNQPVENPERTLLRLSEEQGLPERTRMAMVERVPAFIDGSATQFDLVNLITNQANDLTLRPGVRRNLERAAGRIVAEHADRCSHCQAKLN